MTHFFDPLPLGSFDLLMIDPPWRFASNSAAKPGKNAFGKYECMTLDQIKTLPVADLAAPHCLLWLWATNPMFPQALDVAAAWGFKFSTVGVWVKRTKHGKLAFGTGFRLRGSSEPFIIATRGKPQTSKTVRSVIEGQIREHSRKPESAFEAAERLMPHACRAEIFGRQSRPGWAVWGDQATHFDEVA